MSYLQVTAAWPSLHVKNQHNTLRGSAIQHIAPINTCNLDKSLKPTIGLSKKCTELLRCHMLQRTGATRYQQCASVCLFGEKGESKNGSEASQWKSIEKAMSSFKKEPSLEDVLRQQMEKQDYYDGGSGTGGGGGGGGGGGFGETEDEGFGGILDEILQATLAVLALIVLYLYIIVGDQVVAFIKDSFAFIVGKKGPRMRIIMYEFGKLHEKLRAEVPYDPYWLEKEIIRTPTWWDNPQKYERMLGSSSRTIKSSKPEMDSDADNDDDSDSEDKAYNNNNDDDGSDSDNKYNNDVDEYAYGDEDDDKY